MLSMMIVVGLVGLVAGVTMVETQESLVATSRSGDESMHASTLGSGQGLHGNDRGNAGIPKNVGPSSSAPVLEMPLGVPISPTHKSPAPISPTAQSPVTSLQPITPRSETLVAIKPIYEANVPPEKSHSDPVPESKWKGFVNWLVTQGVEDIRKKLFDGVLVSDDELELIFDRAKQKVPGVKKIDDTLKKVTRWLREVDLGVLGDIKHLPDLTDVQNLKRLRRLAGNMIRVSPLDLVLELYVDNLVDCLEKCGGFGENGYDKEAERRRLEKRKKELQRKRDEEYLKKLRIEQAKRRKERAHSS
jgi:hypothetical protein